MSEYLLFFYWFGIATGHFTQVIIKNSNFSKVPSSPSSPFSPGSPLYPICPGLPMKPSPPGSPGGPESPGVISKKNPQSKDDSSLNQNAISTRA